MASDHERAFFVALGHRLARYRKQAGLTQTVVAERLGLSQQTVDGFEKARSRVQVYALVQLAALFDVSVLELLEERPVAGKAKRGPESRLEARIARIKELPKSQQRAALAMLDGLLESRSSA